MWIIHTYTCSYIQRDRKRKTLNCFQYIFNKSLKDTRPTNRGETSGQILLRASQALSVFTEEGPRGRSGWGCTDAYTLPSTELSLWNY